LVAHHLLGGLGGAQHRLQDNFPFRSAHQQAIDIQLKSGFTFHNLCTLYLTDSVAFIEAFLTHIKNWQREMMLSKFGKAKAFHVNTRVANRFWGGLYKPRAGVSRMLQTGNPQQIAQVTFWATLKSLDVMSRIRKYNFKDDPVVSSELVKFLTVNAGFEVVKQLSVKMKLWKSSKKRALYKGKLESENSNQQGSQSGGAHQIHSVARKARQGFGEKMRGLTGGFLRRSP
jgi:hypothetical protein